MFVQTHRSADRDGTFTVYRDREQNWTVTHYTTRGTVYTGNSLLGEVTIRDENGAAFAFTVKQPPWDEEHGPRTAQAYWNRHKDKLN